MSRIALAMLVAAPLAAANAGVPEITIVFQA